MRKTTALLMTLLVLFITTVTSYAQIQTLDLSENIDVVGIVKIENGLLLQGRRGEVYRIELGQSNAEMILDKLDADRGKTPMSLVPLDDGIYYIASSRLAVEKVTDNNGDLAFDEKRYSLMLPDDFEEDWAQVVVYMAAFNADSGFLFLNQEATNNNDKWLTRLDIRTKTVERFKMPRDMEASVYPYKGNAFLTEQYDTKTSEVSICIFDWETKKTESLASVKERPYGICYDANTDLIYYAVGVELFRLKVGDVAEKVADLPFKQALSASVIINEKYYPIASSQGLMCLYDIDESSTLSILTVLGGTENASGHSAFVTNNINVTVSTPSLPQSTDEFAQMLITGQLDYDVLCLPTGYYDLTQLLKKGYYVPLPDLEGQAKALYENISSVCYQDGVLSAFPYYLELSGCDTYNVEAWPYERFALPNTFDDLLNLAITWDCDDVSLEAYQLLSWDDPREQLVSMYLDRFIGTANKRGEMVDFAAPDFAATLNKIDAAAENLANALNGLQGQVHLVDRSGGMPLKNRFLPLQTQEDNALFFGQLYVYLINPRSNQIELAKQYIEYCANNPSKELDVLIYSGEKEPIQSSNFDRVISNWETEKKDFEQQLEQADDSNKRFVQDLLDEHSARYNNIVAQKYYITKDDIEYYQTQIVHNISIMPPNLFDPETTNGQMFYGLLQRYLQRQIAVTDFATELNRLVSMMDRER